MMLLALPLWIALQSVAAPAPSPSESPTVAIAKANRARVRIRPTYKHEPDTKVPRDAQLEGEHGEVTVAGVVNPDGHMTETAVTASSRSSRIDAAALDAAHEALFEPARDAAGAPLPLYVAVTFNFDNAASFDGKAFGAYRCKQFVRDQAWWRKTWPERPRDKFANLLAGMMITSSGTRPEALQRNAARFDSIWQTTLNECQSKPEAPVNDIFFSAARQR